MTMLAPAVRRPTAPRRAVAAGTPAEALPLTFQAVGRTFGTGAGANEVLRGVDLTVAPGSVVALLGPSGCGKSTLLRAAAGLDAPTAGEVLIGDRRVERYDARCAVAFQEPRLLPWRSLRDNVALGVASGTPRRDRNRQVTELLELVELQDAAGRRPREVSGGMAQRAALARALARRPGVLLLDEPFGALDALTRMKMQDLLLTVHEATPTTVLLVTHDVDEALQLADVVVVLGRTGQEPAAGVIDSLTVPGARPRDRGSEELARIRGRLLERLGVDAHRQ